MTTLFEGHQNHPEHRPVASGRAWCLSCSEWCYPREDAACACCRVPMLEAQIQKIATPVLELRARINMARSLLSHRHFCEECAVIADLILMALDGASIDDMQAKDQ